MSIHFLLIHASMIARMDPNKEEAISFDLSILVAYGELSAAVVMAPVRKKSTPKTVRILPGF